MSYQTSIIISFYNKVESLKMIFAALERQTFKNFEVLIADDGSEQDVVSEIETIQLNYSFPIRHVWHEDKGWRKNIILNKAIVLTSAEYLIFMDGDCIPHPLFVQEHFENKNIDKVVSGRRVMLTKKISNSLTVEQVKNGYLDRKVIFPLAIECVFFAYKTHIENLIRVRNPILRKLFIKNKKKGFWGCNFSIFKANLIKVNGFDERYEHPALGEDTDLEFRLKRIGILPVPKKHMLTQYHLYHIHYVSIHESNLKIFDENNKNLVTYTPFGIIKTT